MKKTNRKNNVQEKIGKRVSIDRPTAYSVINKGHYTALISAAPGDTVEIALDGGDWTSCSYAAGYWRVQLDGMIAGEHRLAARVSEGGRVFVALRRFVVGKRGAAMQSVLS